MKIKIDMDKYEELRFDLQRVVNALDEMMDAHFDRTGETIAENDSLISRMRKKYKIA